MGNNLQKKMAWLMLALHYVVILVLMVQNHFRLESRPMM